MSLGKHLQRYIFLFNQPNFGCYFFILLDIFISILLIITACRFMNIFCCTACFLSVFRLFFIFLSCFFSFLHLVLLQISYYVCNSLVVKLFDIYFCVFVKYSEYSAAATAHSSIQSSLCIHHFFDVG